MSSLQCERPGLGFLKWKKVGEREISGEGVDDVPLNLISLSLPQILPEAV